MSKRIEACLALLTVLCLGTPSLALEPDPGENAYRWQGLGNPTDYTGICRQDDSGALICDDTCPAGLDAICAEFRNEVGHVLSTCCIPRSEEGSLDLGVCLFGVQLIRGEEGPPELHPW